MKITAQEEYGLRCLLQLARHQGPEPLTITLAEALEALGGSFFSTGFCNEHNGTHERCVHLGDCSIRSLWGVLGEIFDRVLSRTTLADLALSTGGCETVKLGADALEGLARPRTSIPLTTRKPS
jgi:DNA-binding IscR family transcriptional regulator